MKVKLGAQPSVPRNSAAGFSVADASYVGIVLLLAAFAYVVFIWAMAFGGFGSESAETARETEQLSQSNVINQVAWVLFAAAGGYVVMTRLSRGGRPVLSASLFFLGAYLALTFVSMLWALAPDISLRRSFQQILIVFVFTGVTMFVGDKARVLNAMFLVLAVAIVINAVLVPVIPPGPLGYSGIYAQKNTLGAIAALTLIFCISYLLSSRASYKIVPAGIAILAGGLLVLSQSKTSLGLAVISPVLAAAVLTLSRLFRTSFLLALTVLAAAAGLFIVAVMEVFELSAEHISLLLFNDTTFTGRTTIWNFVLNFFDQRPWLGWGYQSFWAIGSEAPNLKADNFVSGLNQSHNGYVDILLETGMVGFVIIVAFLINLCRAIERSWSDRADIAILLLSLTLFCSFHNLLESSLTRGFAVPWIILLLVAGIANPAFRQGRAER